MHERPKIVACHSPPPPNLERPCGMRDSVVRAGQVNYRPPPFEAAWRNGADHPDSPSHGVQEARRPTRLRVVLESPQGVQSGRPTSRCII